MTKQKIIKQWLLLSFIILLTGCTSQQSDPVNNVQPIDQDQSIDYEQPIEEEPIMSKLDEIIEKAHKGMISESAYNVFDSSIEQVKTEWGEPDAVDQAGNGFYAVYYKKNATFGFNDAGEIFDARSYGEDLKNITFEDMEEALGKPSDTREINNERIYVYKLEKDIDLKFIIPNSQKGVNHLSVYHPVRAVDRDEKTETNKDYLLEIKGQSNQLTAKSWESMQKWREQIVLFSKTKENVFINGPNKKMVALTFDDGPDPIVTPEILEILAQNNVKGSFFFLGSEVKNYPDVVKRAYDDGNLVLSHSYHHVELTKLSKEKMQAELINAGEMIKSVIGREPAILRTPYGETNDQVASIAQQQGYAIVLWSIDTLDWSQKEAANITKNVTEHVRNGDIILMHSDSDKTETAKALPSIINALKEEGFEIVDLETLLNVKAYK